METAKCNNVTTVYHVQPGCSAYHLPYWKAISNLRSDIENLKNDGRLYKSHDIDRSYNRLINYLDHMSLDETFLNSSEDWNKRYPERELVTQKQAFLRTKNMVDKCRLVDRIRRNLEKNELMVLPENDIRETHAWALHELDGLHSEMYPIASEAHKRINQFSDWMGITDRYDGFRRMLNRSDQGMISSTGAYHPPGGPPMNYIKSFDEVCPFRTASKRWNYPSQFEKAKEVDALPPINIRKCPINKEPKCVDEKSSVDYAGMNSVFPGKTEYQRRYVKGKLDINRNPKTTRYNINPKPNYEGNWTLLNFSNDYYRMPNTQYQENYTWPDGKSIRTPKNVNFPCG